MVEVVEDAQEQTEQSSPKRVKTSLANLKSIKEGIKNRKKSRYEHLYGPLKQLFIAFVEANRTPTGRKKGKQLYRMLSLYKQLKTPKGMRCLANTDPAQPQIQSLEFHFNKLLDVCLQNNIISSTITSVSGTTIVTWFRQLFPDTALSPHPTDYCPTCAYLYKHIVSLKQKLQMLQRHGAASSNDLAELQQQIDEHELQYTYHKKQVNEFIIFHIIP
jgi:hypothetical protein